MQVFQAKFLICGALLLMAHIAFAQDTNLALPAATITSAAFRHPDCPLTDDPLHAILLPHPDDCTKYYSCLNGYAFTLSCPNNLHWSVLTYRCDYPEIAKCNDRHIPTMPETATTLQPTATSYRPEAPLYYSYPGNCNRFYQCQPMNCPDNLYWNNLLQRCDWSPSVECQQTFTPQPAIGLPTPQPTIGLTTPLPTDIPPTAFTPPAKPNGDVAGPTSPSNLPYLANNELDRLCLNTESGVYVKYPGDCHKFIQCSNGFAYVHTCPSYLYWNSQKKVCDRYCV